MKMPGLLDDQELQAQYDRFRVNPIAMNPLQMALYQAGEGIATGQGARLDQVLRGAAQGGVQGYNQALQNQQIYARAKAQMDAQRAQLERELAKEEQERRKRELEIQQARFNLGKGSIDLENQQSDRLAAQSEKAQKALLPRNQAEAILKAKGLPADKNAVDQYLAINPPDRVTNEYNTLVPDAAKLAELEKEEEKQANRQKYIQAVIDGNKADILKYADDNVINTVAANVLKSQEERDLAKSLFERTLNGLDGVYLKQADNPNAYVFQNGKRAIDENYIRSPEYFQAYSTFKNQYAKPILGEGDKMVIPEIPYPAPKTVEGEVATAYGDNLRKETNRETIQYINGAAIVKGLSKTAKESMAGAYKALRFVKRTEVFLDELEASGRGLPTLVEQVSQGTPDAAKLANLYANLVLTIKEKPYNLGVLQGIDNVVLQKVISDPTDPLNITNFMQRMTATGLIRLEIMKNALAFQRESQIDALEGQLNVDGLSSEKIQNISNQLLRDTSKIPTNRSTPKREPESPFAGNPGSVNEDALQGL